MVLGYICNEHGLVHRPASALDGIHRVCPTCRQRVTVVNGAARRSTDTETPRNAIGWAVSLGTLNSPRVITVAAVDYTAAIEAAIERADRPQDVVDVTPRQRNHHPTPGPPVPSRFDCDRCGTPTDGGLGPETRCCVPCQSLRPVDRLREANADAWERYEATHS